MLEFDPNAKNLRDAILSAFRDLEQQVEKLAARRAQLVARRMDTEEVDDQLWGLRRDLRAVARFLRAAGYKSGDVFLNGYASHVEMDQDSAEAAEQAAAKPSEPERQGIAWEHESQIRDLCTRYVRASSMAGLDKAELVALVTASAARLKPGYPEKLLKYIGHQARRDWLRDRMFENLRKQFLPGKPLPGPADIEHAGALELINLYKHMRRYLVDQVGRFRADPAPVPESH